MACDQFFGRSLTKGLDKWSLPVEGTPALISILEEFRRPGSNPHHSLSIGPLEMVNQSFLVLCSMEILIEIASFQRLYFLMPPEYSAKNIAILSGSLAGWKHVTVNMLKQSSSTEAKLLFNKIVWHLESMNLGGIFGSYRKISSKDGTFYMRMKNA